MAVSFEEAARKLHAAIFVQGEFTYLPGFPVYFLFFRSIELALKAFLLRHGVPIERLRRNAEFGHQIDRLFAEAKQHGLSGLLSVDSDEDRILCDLSKEYATKRIEFPSSLWGPRPELEALQTLCRKVVYSVEGVACDSQERYSSKNLLGTG